jgi:hypothetical protein
MSQRWRLITASILAATHGLKPRLSSMMIGFEPISITFSLLVFCASIYLIFLFFFFFFLFRYEYF